MLPSIVGARDWVLKRLLAFLVRKHLGRYLRGGGTDLQRQLDVQAGRLQLADVELDVDVLNADLVGTLLHACVHVHACPPALIQLLVCLALF